MKWILIAALSGAIYEGVDTDGNRVFTDRPTHDFTPKQVRVVNSFLPYRSPEIPEPPTSTKRQRGTERPDPAQQNADECERLRNRIRLIREERRAGYDANRGRKLERDEQSVRRQMRAKCR
ncbi:MAG: hypothetical protein DHS20C11_28880 [Lysobacteraceae bacterium]|nr:MAG: hypothetical protein DHS20C11_28880 [Xanthomonadaceae bacterium]